MIRAEVEFNRHTCESILKMIPPVHIYRLFADIQNIFTVVVSFASMYVSDMKTTIRCVIS